MGMCFRNLAGVHRWCDQQTNPVDDASDGCATNTDNGILTPRSTEPDIPNEPNHGKVPDASTAPHPGKKYIVTCISEPKQVHLTLSYGEIALEAPNTNIATGFTSWRCVDGLGWLGLQSSVSGCYLGHNCYNRVVCQAEDFAETERLNLRVHPEGGWVFMFQQGMMNYAVAIDGGKLKMVDGGVEKGARWSFLEV